MGAVGGGAVVVVGAEGGGVAPKVVVLAEVLLLLVRVELVLCVLYSVCRCWELSPWRHGSAVLVRDSTSPILLMPRDPETRENRR